MAKVAKCRFKIIAIYGSAGIGTAQVGITVKNYDRTIELVQYVGNVFQVGVFKGNHAVVPCGVDCCVGIVYGQSSVFCRIAGFLTRLKDYALPFVGGADFDRAFDKAYAVR